jgi:putative tryptophan/tyrosine transport system substrate-binding protein
MGQQLEIIAAATTRDISPAFSEAVRKQADALLIHADPMFTNRRVQLATLAARYAIPAIYSSREFAEVGGLMSYGANLADIYRQIGTYTGRILKGTKPADLPVEQPTKFDLIINVTTAKALGLTIPESFLLRADEMTE